MFDLGVGVQMRRRRGAPPPPAVSRFFFAHYMVAVPTYYKGESTAATYKEAMRRDIRDAKAVGIDGFALNLGDWFDGVSGDSNYNLATAAMFLAAEEEGGFYLFPSFDWSTPSKTDSMFNTHKNSPAWFKYGGQWVVSTFDNWGAVADWSDWMAARAGEGYPILAMPYRDSFSTTGDGWPRLEAIAQSHWNAIKTEGLGGHFFFGSAPDDASSIADGGNVETSARANSMLSKAIDIDSKYAMVGTAFNYWGIDQAGIGYRYIPYRFLDAFEVFFTHATYGVIATRARDTNMVNPRFIEWVTWNDFGEETHLTPHRYPNDSWPQRVEIQRHTGFYEMMPYYVDFFKDNARPTITQELVTFGYRRHGKDAVLEKKPGIVGDDTVVQDIIYVAAFLNSGADVRVTINGVATTLTFAAGVSQQTVSFSGATGTVLIEVRRGGVTINQMRGANILTQYPIYSPGGATLVEANYCTWSEAIYVKAPVAPTISGTNVQRGEVTFGAANLSEAVTITAVDLAKSFVNITVRAPDVVDGLPGQHEITAALTATTTLTLTRGATGSSPVVCWEVASFTTGVSVQRGQVTITNTGAPQEMNIAISAIDRTKTFLIFTNRAAGSFYTDDDFIRGYFTSDTELLFSTFQGSGQVVEWQVVTYQGVAVQHYNVITLPGGTGGISVPLTTPVNPHSCLVLTSFEFQVSFGAAIPVNQVLYDAWLTQRAVHIERPALGSTTPQVIAIQVIEFLDGSKVQRDWIDFSTTTSSVAVTLYPAVTLAKSMTFGTGWKGKGQGGSASDAVTVAGGTLFLTNTTTLTANRTGHDSVTARQDWQVIEFAA